MSITEYKTLVDSCAFGGCDHDISNSKPEHARHLIMRLLSIAKENVSLFSGCLAQRITPDGTDKPTKIFAWDPLIIEAVMFLKKPGTKLRIVLQHDVDGGDITNHPLVGAILQAGLDEKLEVYQLSGKSSFKDIANLHFMTVDGTSYRIETDTDKKTAVANFNSPDLAQRLRSVFERLLKNSEPLLVHR